MNTETENTERGTVELLAEPWRGLLSAQQMVRIWMELRRDFRRDLKMSDFGSWNGTKEMKLYLTITDRFIIDASMVGVVESSITN